MMDGHMPVIQRDCELMLSRAQNGGWILSDNRGIGMMPNRLAAFSDGKDLIVYLDRLLCEPAAAERIDG